MSLADRLGRPLRNLRLSVTDRCNLRCAYCMPEPDYVWLPNEAILSFEELSSLVDRFVAVGVRTLRLTGGEPLVRRELDALVRQLATKPGLEEISLTTNGVLLAEHAHALSDAGLTRVTVSLDTLSPERFRALTKRDLLPQVLEGIAAAGTAGFPGPLKLDTVVLRGVNDDELEPLLAFAENHQAELRFIEYMDVGGATRWTRDHVVSRTELLGRLENRFGAIEPLEGRGAAPAERFVLPGGQTFGIIASTTAPFCRSCDRARLTADGHFFDCLYATRGLDLKTPLRSGASPEALEGLLAKAWGDRAARGAEERAALHAARGPLASQAVLRADPHLEMHTRGG